MGNVPSSQFSVFSEIENENNDKENRLINNEISDTNHYAINRENSKEKIHREYAVEGENSRENSNLCSAAPVSKQNHSELNHLRHRNRQQLEEFQEEFDRKHAQRREIMAAKKKEMEDLRNEVEILRKENESLRMKTLNEENKQSKNILSINSDPELGTKIEETIRLQNSVKENEEINKELTKIKEENLYLKLSLTSDANSCEITSKIEKLFQENGNLKNELNEKINQLENMSILLDKNKELRISIAEMQGELQNLNKVVVNFEQEREEYRSHVVALKDVINVSKKMLLIREGQLRELRQKVESIEASLSGKEMNLLSQDLRLEYERQLQSIRNLKSLYEERQRSDQKEKEELRLLLEETKKELETEKKKNEESEERIQELEQQNSQKYDEIKSLESNLGLSKAESRQYQAELTVINQLFSEILLGFNTNQEIDLDRLTKHLEDHHGLLKEIVINEISPASSSALPKTLLDLLSQLHESKKNQKAEDNVDNCEENAERGRLETITEESESQTTSYDINSAKEIVELLPKVWRVLIELLSHQKVPTNVLTEEKQPNDENPCYKTVQTPKGPSLVLSVSQTFIRLKDLILEKKSLEKETGHLKQLNGHLESRLQDQEKRLTMVSSELNKTWHVVGKLQKQHQLLHTQEKILRYELAQKRKLLTTLKEELEYSREKWQQAREKNSTTEKQWKQLRGEFAARKKVVATDDFNNSVESGYSDEKCSSSDDEIEKGYETDVSECALKLNVKEHAFGSESDIATISNQNIEKTECNTGDTEVCNDMENLRQAELNEKFNQSHNESRNDTNKNPKITEGTNDTESQSADNKITPEPLELLEVNKNITSDTISDLPEYTSEPTNSNDAVPYSSEIPYPQLDETTNENCTNNITKKSVTELIYEELEELLKNEERLTQIPKNVDFNQQETCGEHSKTENKKNDFTSFKSEKHSVVEEIWSVKNDILSTIDKHLPKIKDIVIKNSSEVYDTNFQGDANAENPSTSTATQNTSTNDVGFKIENQSKDSETPSTSSEKPKRTLEEILAAKEARLTRLEGQCQQLVDKVTNTTTKRKVISNKLDGLHETYGEKSANSVGVEKEENFPENIKEDSNKDEQE